MDLAFNILDYWCPHDRSEGLFNDGDAQIVEMSPVIVKVNLENLRDVSKGDHITVPSIELTLIQVCSTTIGTKKEVEGLKKLWGWPGL